MGVDVLLYLFDFVELKIFRDYSLSYDSLVDLVVIILLSIAILVIVLAPVFLFCCWAIYSVDYVKNYRSSFSVQKWFSGRSDRSLAELSDLIWMHYRTTYARMVGFGMSIFGYGTASSFYIILNFKRIEVGLTEYFRFPFRAVENFDQIELVQRMESVDQIMFPSDKVWAEMLSIVVISIIFFIVGYVFSGFLVDYRLRKLRGDIKVSIKQMMSKKEMFSIKGEIPKD
jgi:hypothetical protein